MKVKSTGLGKTQLTAHFDGFTAKEGGGPSAVLIITSTEPVHWHIECDLGGSDLRQFAGQVLRPGMIWHLVKLLARGGEAGGFVMENEGGRRSKRERVTRDVAAGGSSQTEAASASVSATEAAPATPVAAETAPPTTPTGPTTTPAAAQPTRVHASAKTNGDGAAEREQREQQRADRRRQREEAAHEHATALRGD